MDKKPRKSRQPTNRHHDDNNKLLKPNNNNNNPNRPPNLHCSTQSSLESGPDTTTEGSNYSGRESTLTNEEEFPPLPALPPEAEDEDEDEDVLSANADTNAAHLLGIDVQKGHSVEHRF